MRQIILFLWHHVFNYDRARSFTLPRTLNWQFCTSNATVRVFLLSNRDLGNSNSRCMAGIDTRRLFLHDQTSSGSAACAASPCRLHVEDRSV